MWVHVRKTVRGLAGRRKMGEEARAERSEGQAKANNSSVPPGECEGPGDMQDGVVVLQPLPSMCCHCLNALPSRTEDRSEGMQRQESEICRGA